MKPNPGDWVNGEVVTQVNVAEIDEEDWPTEFFQPTVIQISSSIFLIAIGFGATVGVSLIGRTNQGDSETSQI